VKNYKTNSTMTSQNQSPEMLADQTVQALNGSPSDVSLTDGTSLISSWISSLGANSAVGGKLSTLKSELQKDTPDGDEISSILMDLADQTREAASTADNDTQATLEQLASSLKNFSQQL
jgi:hypothetical protein